MGNYEEWKDEYYKTEKVDLKKYLSEKDFDVIKKIGIEVLDKTYTESEFEVLYLKIIGIEGENEAEDLDEVFENLNVIREDYESVVDKLERINEEYDF